jgi:uncharacterized membrane protein
MQSAQPSKRLRDHTRIPLETLIVVLSIAPILLLIYFYPTLPNQIPVFLNFRGDVEVWADKSVVSVFRVPLMALDLQLIFLLMKNGTLQFKPKVRAPGEYQTRLRACGVGLWDWFRCFNAIKMSVESLDILFMSDERMRFLRTPAWALTWTAVILGVVGALAYGYRLLIVNREMKRAVGEFPLNDPIDKAHVYGGVFYYNPSDSAMFVDKYGINFGNKWVYALIACVVAYPLLVFSTSLLRADVTG